MKKCFLSILLITVMRLVPSSAQVPPEQAAPVNKQAQIERVEALKMGYISQRLNLTDAEREKFLLSYWQYRKEMRAANSNPGVDEITKDETLLNIRKRYQEQFTAILGRNRANYVFQLEKEFNQMLFNRVRPRMGMRKNF